MYTVVTPKSRPAWVFLTLVGWVFGAHAAGDSPQLCAAIGDDSERLACYDRIFRAPLETAAAAGAASTTAGAAATTTVAPTSTPAVAPAAAAAIAPAAATPSDDFGLTEAAKRARDPERAKDEKSEGVTATVAAVARRPAGELLVTLDNGQVWTQVDVDQRARVVVGDTVSIKRGALSSYLLVTQSRYATRVRRVK